MQENKIVEMPASSNHTTKSQSIAPLEKGKYKVHGLIGEGAIGKILLASVLPFNGEEEQYELTDANVVVLKLIELSTKGCNQAFQQEAYLLHMLKHPNILESREAYVFTHGRRNTKFGVIVTEKLDVDLMDYVLENGALKEAEARRVFRDICLAVDYCHSRNVAHLDIKPDNILLSLAVDELSDELINPYHHESDQSDSEVDMCQASPKHQLPRILRAKLCDFGFATEWDKTEEVCAKVGTKEYRAPEAFFTSKKTLNTRHFQLDKLDIWALGVTLFVLLTTCFPFSFNKKNTSCFRLPLSFVNNYSSENSCEQLLSMMLKKDPRKRPSIKEILAHPWLNEN